MTYVLRYYVSLLFSFLFQHLHGSVKIIHETVSLRIIIMHTGTWYYHSKISRFDRIKTKRLRMCSTWYLKFQVEMKWWLSQCSKTFLISLYSLCLYSNECDIRFQSFIFCFQFSVYLPFRDVKNLCAVSTDLSLSLCVMILCALDCPYK